MSNADLTVDDIDLPIKRTEGDTLEERLTGNAYHNILPARYLRKDANGDPVEEQEDLFVRVAKNIALAEAVYEAENQDVEVTVTPDQLKPDHPRRDELAAEVFGKGTTAEDWEADDGEASDASGGTASEAETVLTQHNVNKFAYDTVVPELPDEVREHVEETAEEFQTLMEDLSFMPNSPTLMNAGDELQQLSACFVDSPDDDIDDIHQTAKEAAQVFQCLTADTTVSIEGEGIVSIADVEPGDRIVQRDGTGHRTRTVEETHAYHDAPVHRIETAAGVDITGTPNHELLVDGDWDRIDAVEPGDTLSLRLGWIDATNATPELTTVADGAQWSEQRTVSNDEILEHYAEGLSDYEIADRLDSSASTIQRRRSLELGLDPNGTGGRPGGSVDFDETEFDSLYADGRSDGEIASQLGVSARAVARHRENHSLEANGEAVTTVRQPTELTPELAELVGMWVGDGSKHQDGIRFHLNRDETLEHVDRLCRDLFDTDLDWRWDDGCYDAVIHSHEVKRWWLANFGDAKPDATSASVPDPVWRAGREVLGAFLRGLFSTDGSLQNDAYPRFWTSSRELIDDVQQLLLGVGIPATRWEYDADHREYYNVGPTGERGLDEFLDTVGFVDSRSETMVETFDGIDSKGPNVGTVDGSTWEVPVETVEEAGTATVYDVTVAGDHEYVASSIVSHNSGGGMGYAFWRLRPYGDAVGSTGGIASGPITFMRTFDQMCFPPGTDVLTPSGQRPIESLEEGETVVDENGDERPVVETMKRRVNEDIVEITPERLNEPIRATGEHPFRVVRDGDLEWVDADELEADDYLVLGNATRTNGLVLGETVDLTSVASGPLVFTDGGITVNREYYGASRGRTPESIADEVPVADFATIAGWYLAEGCVVYRRGVPNEVTFTLHNDERAAVSEICDALDRFDVPTRVEPVEDRNTVHVHVESASFAQLVEGLFGTGAAEKEVPELFWKAPPETQAVTLEALFDGDGRLETRGQSQRVQLKLANKEVVDFVFQAGLRCGVQFSRHDRTPDDRKPTFSVSASVSTAIGTPLERLFDEVPDGFSPRDRTKRARGREVVAIDEIDRVHYDGPVYNIEVPETHSYVAEDVVVHNCETIAQGGARRGAQMGVMRISHPDVIQFIHAKNKDVSLAHTLRLNDPDDFTHNSFADALEEARELIDEDGKVPKHLRNAVEGHLSNFNISVGITDDFMEAVKNDEEHTFTNPRTDEPHVATAETKELYEMFDLGEHVEVGEVLSVPAQKVWERIIDGAHENGEPGVVYLERINKEHSFDVAEHPDHRILATNPCITGDTLISTENGLVPAEELYEQGVAQDVVVDGRLSEDCVKEASSVYKTGKKDVYKLTTEEGYELRLTADHRVMTDDGWVEAQDLDAGDTVHVQNRKGEFGQHGSVEEGRVLGWLVGDGHLKDGEERAVLNFYDEDAEVSEQFAADANEVVREPTGNADYEIGVSEIARGNDYRGAQAVEQRVRSERLYEYAEEAGLVENKLQVPDAVMRGNEKMARGFLRALFSADSSVQGNVEKGVSVRLTSTDADLLKDAQRMLLNFGIFSKIYEERHDAGPQELPDGNGATTEYERQADHDLVISKDDLVRFRDEIGFLLDSKNEALDERLDAYDRGPYSESFDATVESVERDGHEAVYDLTEPETHSFIANGLVTHNCGEQPLEEYEACNLGHINLSTLASTNAPDWRVWSERHTDEYDSLEDAVDAFLREAIDFDAFDHRIEMGTRFLENVVTMSDFPVPKIERTVREMRKIGLGVMGLAQLYIQLGMKYGDDVSNEVARQLMRHINNESKWASHELAQDRSSFAEWDNSKYANPTEYREWFEKQTDLDADEWAEGFAMRNHNTTTIAPTGTTSMVGNTTGGCEPIYNVAYYKNVSDDVQGDEMLVEFDDYFLRVLEENDLDIEAVKEEAQEQMANNEFDGVDGLSTVPDAVGELFVTTGDLSAKDHAGVQVACQEGVDSAISKCLEKETLVQTDSGVRPIESFADETPKPGEFVDVDEEVTIDGVPVESQYYAGEKDATRVRVDNGTEIVGATESHKVLTPDGWKVLGELEAGDYVIGRQFESHSGGGVDIAIGRQTVAADGGATLTAGGADPTAYEKDVTLPPKMSQTLARFLGMYAADGSAVDGTYTIEISTSSERVRDEACELFETLFDREPTVEADTRRGQQRDIVYGVKLNSKPVWEFVTELCDSGSYEKEVPSEVLQGSPEEKTAFVNGVTLDGYVSSQSLVVYDGMSKALADGVAELLRSFGVPKVYVGRKWVDESDAYSYNVHVTNDAQELVTPIEPHKRVDRFDQRYRVYVPQDRVDKTDFGSRTQEYYAARTFEYRDRNYMFNTTAEKLGIEDAPPLYEVTDVADAGTREMYDIELAGPHEYVVGGVVSHNTVNAPNDSTTEDAAEVFEYIYDHGGKGVTYYRDGTRSKQVLTTRAQNTEFSEMDAEEVVAQIEEVFGGLDAFLEEDAVQAAVEQETEQLLGAADGDRPEYAQKRSRPDVLHGVTQRIDTGYGKLYVNINEDPEAERPFELFANIGNSGGFTASFTEALAKTISTALRAGVDPHEIADELQGIRSPKVAWDKGEQIQSIPDAIGTALRRYLDDEIDKGYPQQQTLEETAEEREARSASTGASGETASDDSNPNQDVSAAEPETDGGLESQSDSGAHQNAPSSEDGASVSISGGDADAGPDAGQANEDAQQELIEAGESPECPECSSLSLYYSEGCKTCESCGWSEC